MSSDAPALLSRHGEAVTSYLRSLLGRYPDAPPRLMEAVEYSLMAGGKRLRPALVLESAAACNAARATVSPSPGIPGEGRGEGLASEESKSHPHPNPLPEYREREQKERTDTKSNASALAAAGAIELIHTFSLVHDDLPAMDDDDLRRGRPASHKVFGEAMAILAGDAMVAMAFEAIAADADPAVAPALVAELATATGPGGMIGGQVIDLASSGGAISLPELQALHRMKTGALLVASCRMGAIAAGAARGTLDAVTGYAQHLGLAFQIVDDLLDVTSTPEQLGKATRKDAAKGKTTYPGLIGVDASREEANRQLAAAINALEAVIGPVDGLQQLARFVVQRRA